MIKTNARVFSLFRARETVLAPHLRPSLWAHAVHGSGIPTTLICARETVLAPHLRSLLWAHTVHGSGMPTISACMYV